MARIKGKRTWTAEDWHMHGYHEKHLQSYVLKELNEIPCCYARGVKKTNQNGVPDILCCYHGKFIAIELKALGGTTTPLQERNLKQINDAYGMAFVATCWADIEKHLDLICVVDVESALANSIALM